MERGSMKAPGAAGRVALVAAGRVALVAAAVLVSLVVLEVACRVARGGPGALTEWPNLARGRIIEAGDACSYVDDPRLGWALPSRCRSPGYNVTDGFRDIPAAAAPL